MGLPAAKQMLGQNRIWWQLSTRTLEPVRNASGDVGVSRQSVEREIAWRRDAGALRRAWRVVRNLIDLA